MLFVSNRDGCKGKLMCLLYSFTFIMGATIGYSGHIYVVQLVSYRNGCMHYFFHDVSFEDEC